MSCFRFDSLRYSFIKEIKSQTITGIYKNKYLLGINKASIVKIFNYVIVNILVFHNIGILSLFELVQVIKYIFHGALICVRLTYLVLFICWISGIIGHHLIPQRNPIVGLQWRKLRRAWWRHHMETYSALLAICARNSPVTGEFSAQRPVTQSFDVFFNPCLIKRLSKQSRGWWFETLSRLLWRHCNGIVAYYGYIG